MARAQTFKQATWRKYKTNPSITIYNYIKIGSHTESPLVMWTKVMLSSSEVAEENSGLQGMLRRTGTSRTGGLKLTNRLKAAVRLMGYWSLPLVNWFSRSYQRLPKQQRSACLRNANAKVRSRAVFARCIVFDEALVGSNRP